MPRLSIPHQSSIAPFAAFFLLLSSYYILRPLRETMGIAGGLDQLHWVMTASCVAACLVIPLFGWAAARLRRAVLVPVSYAFFISHLLIFAILMARFPESPWAARAFVVWVSVFNLFAVSLFWSLMADVYSDREARVRFGPIAAGGSAGALAGPLITHALVGSGIYLLPLVSAALLTAATVVLALLARRIPRKDAGSGNPPGVLEAVRLVAKRPYLGAISFFVFVSTLAPTLLYLFQGRIVEGAFSTREDQTRFFASLDLAVNVITMGIQLFGAPLLLKRFGAGAGLAGLPLFAAAGLSLLACLPILPVFVVVQVLYRAGVYGVGAPSQELLFTVVEPDEKYQAKNAIETLVARGGDAAAAWLARGLQTIWVSLGALAAAGVPFLLFTAWVGAKITRRHAALAAKQPRA